MWKSVVEVSEFAWDIIKNMADVIANFFSEDIATAIGNLNIPILSNAVEWILNNFLNYIGVEQLTVFEFTFTVGVTAWLVITIVKFFKSIIL